jgi:hypothetical protein
VSIYHLVGDHDTQPHHPLTAICGAKTAERWDVSYRIRDVEEGPDCSLWMLEDANPGALFHVTPQVINSLVLGDQHTGRIARP